MGVLSYRFYYFSFFNISIGTSYTYYIHMIGTLEEYVTRAGWRFYTDREIVESENYSEMRLRLERVQLITILEGL